MASVGIKLGGGGIMKILKKVIIALCVVILIIMIIILGLKGQIKNNKEEADNKNGDNIAMKDAGFSDVDDYTTYYTVKEAINNYVTYIKEINGDQYIEREKLNMTDDEISKTLQDEGIVAIKNILDKQYIEDMSIDDNTIKSEQNKYKKIGNYNKNVTYDLNIEETRQMHINENITLVLVEAKLNDIDFNMLMKLDKLNNTYSIFLDDYIKKYDYNKEMGKEDVNIKGELIEANDYNSHIKVDVSETNIVSQYFSEYRMKMLENTEKAYELLDTDYNDKKFGTYENFKKYVESNKDKIMYASISKYQVLENDRGKEYVCIDNHGKYYIFNESKVTEYRAILDTYTSDIPEFLEKYNSSSGEEKAGMNIQKIFDAINDEDYNYAYNKLDDTFKQNNFSTEEEFEKYAKQYFSNNNLKYNDCEISGELYIYDITINEEAQDIDQRKVIVKLLDGTDFVMSFSI